MICDAQDCTMTNNPAVQERTLMIQSYTIFACYLVLSIVCYFFFYHHPSHIDIQIRKTMGNVTNIGFNVDNTASWRNAHRSKPESLHSRQ